MPEVTTKVSVTQEDIDDGHANDRWRCPIARALRRVTSAPFLEVSDDRVRMSLADGETADLDTRCQLALPSEATAFVHNFDRHIPSSPFNFDLDIPQDFLKKSEGK